MSNQLQITGGAKVRNLEGVITGSTGVLNSLPINGANGIPQLDSSGKILVSQLPNSVMEYQGTWNVATNTPYLVNGVGNAGDVYLVTGAATGGTNHNFGAGNILFYNGDQAIYDGSAWQRASGSSGTVTSVAVTESSAALNITGSPITTSGTINIGFAGTSAQYVAGDGSLITFPSLTGYVPYTGATNDVDLGTHKLSLYSEQFASISAPTYSEGALWYDSTQKALAYYNDISNNILHIGQEVQLKVHNNTGSTIAKGAPVYVTSTSSGYSYPNVALAKADTLTTANVIGLANQAIPNGTDGYITLSGLLTGANTGSFTVGDVLYLSPYSAGQLMNTMPPTGYAVRIGVVSYSNTPNGTIYINQSNAYSTAANIVGTIQISQGGTGATTAGGALTNLGAAASSRLISTTTPLQGGGDLTADRTLSILQSGTSQSGYLSSTDWNTFNNKQNALGYVPVGGSGSINYLAKFTGPTTISNSIFYDDGTTAQINGSLNVQGTLVVSPSSGFPQATILGAGATQLRIQTSSSSYNSEILFTSGPTATYGLLRYDNTNNYLTIYANSIAYSRLFNNGNFVIGSTLTDSGFKLEVQGTAKISGQLTLGSTITNGTYTYTLPSATGTLALTSQIPSLTGYVPYTGATGAVNLGAYDLTVHGIRVGMGAFSATTAGSVVLSDSGLGSNTTGVLNVAVGSIALQSNTTGSFNTAVGGGTMPNNSTGSYNTALGYQALSGVTGSNNIGIGNGAGALITTGSNNTIIGNYSVSGGTSNNVILADGAGNVRFQWDGSTTRLPSYVSIGNTNSTYNLDVTGTGRFTGNTYISAGDFGVGTTSPETFSGYRTAEISATAGGIVFAKSTTGSITTQLVADNGTSSGYVGTRTNHAFSIRTNNTDKVTITPSGNVGIGTTSPSGKLNISNGGAAGLEFDATGGASSGGYIQAYNRSTSAFTPLDIYANLIAFQTGTGGSSTERMRITSGGNVLVNRSASAPGIYKLVVNTGTDLNVGFGVQNGEASIESFNDAVNTGLPFRIYGNPVRIFNTIYFSSYANGSLSISSGQVVSSSDSNLKNEAGFIDNALNKVMNLKPRYFYWKEESGINSIEKQLGFYAQEVNEALGEEAANNNSNEKWGIYDRAIIAMLTKAIQEQQAQIEELKSLINK